MRVHLGAYAVIGGVMMVGATQIALGVVSTPWAVVGDVGNPVNLNGGFGSVNHVYYVSSTEVTNAQYAQFLNAVDPSGTNALQLYHPGEAEFGLTNTGVGVGNKYAALAGRGNQPVVNVTWYSAIRYANWLNNGQGGPGTTEVGAYTLLGGGPTPTNGTSITRNSGATIFLPNQDEWFKAAFWDPTLKGGTGDYWLYATRSNALPDNPVPPGDTNSANFYNNDFALTPSPDWNPALNYLTDVGAYTHSMSYYHTFDQAGNVSEWVENPYYGTNRGIRGASWSDVPGRLENGFFDTMTATLAESYIGFRVASIVPEPGTLGILLPGVLLLRRGRKNGRDWA